LIASAHESMHPVTRGIILGGARPTAVDAFAAFYKLKELQRVREHVFREIDALLLPTTPTVYTVEQVNANPVELNSRLGTYTNFRQPLEPLRPCLPGLVAPGGAPVRRAIARARGPRCDARFDRPRVPRRYPASARRARRAASAAAAIAASNEER